MAEIDILRDAAAIDLFQLLFRSGAFFPYSMQENNKRVLRSLVTVIMRGQELVKADLAAGTVDAFSGTLSKRKEGEGGNKKN